MTGDPVVHLPAELELEERLAGPVTFRMAGWLAGAGAGVALVAFGWGQPGPVVAGSLLLPAGLAGAFWQPGGRPLTAWCGPLTSYRRRLRAEQRAVRVSGRAPDVTADIPPIDFTAGADLQFEEVLRRTGPPVRWLRLGALTASAALVVGLAIGGWALRSQPGGASPGLPAPVRPVAEPALPPPAPASPPALLPPPLVGVDPFGLPGFDGFGWRWLDCGC